MLITQIKSALHNRQTWLGGLYTCFFNLPIPLLGAVWGTLYLSQIHRLSRIESSNILSMLFLGIIVGAPLFGWLSGKIERFRLPMTLGAVLSLIVVLVIIYLPNLSNTSLFVAFFTLGLFSSVQTIGYSVVMEGNPLSRSTALSIASLLVMGGGAAAQPLFGWLMDYSWNGTIIDQIHIYSADNYSTAMLIFPIAFIMGLAAAFFVRDTLSQP